MNLLPLYIGTAIFGIGILAIDIFGVFSSIGEDNGDADSGDFNGDMGADDGADADFGSEGGQADHSGHEGHGAVTMHSQSSSKFVIVKIITILRSLVYFSLGFGAIGLFALYKGKSQLESLLWSIPFGLFIMFIARLVKRIQRHELDSQFKKHELLMEEAEVIVPIPKSGIGKIRIDYEGIHIERYAKTKNPDNSFKKGDKVNIVEITDEYFFVE